MDAKAVEISVLLRPCRTNLCAELVAALLNLQEIYI